MGRPGKSDLETLRVAAGQASPRGARLPAGFLRFHPLGEPPTMRFFVLDAKGATFGRAEAAEVQVEARLPRRGHWRIDADLL
jgi:hypothetical protein